MSCITSLYYYFFRYIVKGMIINKIDDHKLPKLNILTKDRAEKKLVITIKINPLKILIKGRFISCLTLAHTININTGILAIIIICRSELSNYKTLRKAYNL